jgi:branched-chain amino acid transport system substrate-binding protein
MRSASLRLAIGLIPLVVLASACSGSDSESGGSADDAGLTGDPIKLSVMATADGITGAPEVFDGAQAAAAAINEAGGIEDPAGGDAHPLEIVECRVSSQDSTSNPAVARECAEDAISEGVVADVGKFLFAAQAIEAFQQAGVPLIGTFAVDPTDYISPNVFAVSGGAAISLSGVGAALQEAGATTLGFVSADNPAGRGLPALIAPVVGGPQSIVVQEYLPLDPSVDVTPFVSRLARANPDGIILGQTASLSVRLTKALRQAGYEGLIGWTAANLNEKTIGELGPDTQDIVVSSNYPAVTAANSEIERYVAEMEEYAPDALLDEYSLNAWYAVQVTAAILGEVDEFTGEAVMAAAKGFEVDDDLVPAFTLGELGNYAQLPTVPRATVYAQTLEDGELNALGDVIDLNALVGAP